MKFYISADIEGVAGVVNHEQTLPGRGFEWERARVWMTEEVIAAAEAARAIGAEEVIVSDSHASGLNILLERLPPYIRLVRSTPRPLDMMQGIEEEGVGACAFIGYHASSHCATGLLSHTFNGMAFRSVRFNGVVVSEVYANAALAGECGIPLVAISGDTEFIAEARQWFPDVEAAPVKQSYTRVAAITVTPSRAQELIRAAVDRGLRRVKEFRPFVIPSPIAVDIEFVHRLPVELLDYLPCFERLDTYTVRYAARSVAETIRVMQFASQYSARAGTVTP
jgi:D-amino peptidase